MNQAINPLSLTAVKFGVLKGASHFYPLPLPLTPPPWFEGVRVSQFSFWLRGRAKTKGYVALETKRKRSLKRSYPRTTLQREGFEENPAENAFLLVVIIRTHDVKLTVYSARSHTRTMRSLSSI